MQRGHLYSVSQLAMKGFIPGALLIMIAVGVGLPVIFSRNHFRVLKDISWVMFLIEIIVLTAGFVFVALSLTSKRLAPERWRAILAGITSVLLLGVTSLFTQGAGMPVYLIASFLAGVIGSFSLSSRFTQVQG